MWSRNINCRIIEEKVTDNNKARLPPEKYKTRGMVQKENKDKINYIRIEMISNL